MSIHVADFKWEKGKNDLEYIALLEKTLDVMEYNLKKYSKIAKEQYNKGYEKGKADGVREFAEKIKSHMTKYCQSRLEQQYCAMEVIDYIGKLMGDKDFSIDVEKEINEHDSKVVREFAEWLQNESDFNLDYCDWIRCIGAFNEETHTVNRNATLDDVLAEYETYRKGTE